MLSLLLGMQGRALCPRVLHLLAPTQGAEAVWLGPDLLHVFSIHHKPCWAWQGQPCTSAR